MKIECAGHSVWGPGTPSSQKGVVGVALGVQANNVRPLYPDLFPTLIVVFCISFGYITSIGSATGTATQSDHWAH